MRTYIITAILLCNVLSYGYAKDRLKGRPTTLEETFIYLDNTFDDTSKYTFMTMPEDVATTRLHMGFGMSIRNRWGLWGNSKLKHYFLEKGVFHPDDMSGIIFTSYHRYLNNRPIELDSQINSYRRYWNAQMHADGFSMGDLGMHYTTDSALVQYFPVGDTILVSIYASYKKWFTSYASGVRGIAIVKAHNKDYTLQIKLIKVMHENRLKPDRKEGDVYEINPMHCSLMPPKDWVFKK